MQTSLPVETIHMTGFCGKSMSIRLELATYKRYSPHYALITLPKEVGCRVKDANKVKEGNRHRRILTRTHVDHLTFTVDPRHEGITNIEVQIYDPQKIPVCIIRVELAAQASGMLPANENWYG